MNKVKYQGISTLEVLSDAKNYNRWIADEVLENINYPALEIGSGTGNLTSYFIKGLPFYITDKDKGLVSLLSKKFSRQKNVHFDIFDLSKNPKKNLTSSFSSVFGINVLEHIEDDEKALKNIYKVLKKDGKLVLLVPAKKIAYTRLDKELGHFRRYEKKELEKKLINAGFEIKKIYFFNIVGLASWYVRDKVQGNKIHLRPYQVRIFDIIVPPLRFIESMIKVPVGISLIAVVEKK